MNTSRASSITVVDRTCVDCGGPVTLFFTADKVWNGLGLAPDDWICIPCFARRLNPQMETPDNPLAINGEIARQRRRFSLKRTNIYCGDVRLPLAASFRYAIATEDEVRELTAAQCGTCNKQAGKHPSPELPEARDRFIVQLRHKITDGRLYATATLKSETIEDGMPTFDYHVGIAMRRVKATRFKTVEEANAVGTQLTLDTKNLEYKVIKCSGN